MSLSVHKTRIRQIISSQMITVGPDTPVTDALSAMAAHRISCLIVAEDSRPVGILTERDVVRMANRASSFGCQPIRDFMSCPVVSIPGHLSVIEAYNLMLTNRIRHHVVVNRAGRMLGVMSQSDLINLLGLEYFVEMRKVEQVMTVGVLTVSPEVTVSGALAHMAGPGISCVVVSDGGEPVGILTERDAVRLVAARIDLDAVTVGSVMSTPVQKVMTGTTVHRAATIMKERRIRRVLVVDKEGKVRGIVTQTDIIKGLEGKYVESLKEIIREKEEIFQETARQLIDKTVYLDNILSSSIDSAIVATDGDLKIKYFNPVAEGVFGCTAGHAIGRSALELHSAVGVPAHRLQRAREVVRKEGKYPISITISRDGRTRYYDGGLSSILDRQAEPVGYVLMLHDVTERREYESTIHHMAYHDALTGLPNRVLLNDRLNQALKTSARNGTSGALMILDLDRFKDINDTLGHSVGDQLLQGVSDRLKSTLRKSDTVSRMGGDEFVLLLPTIASEESAGLIAAKIVRNLRKPVLCEGHPLKITASIGIAIFPCDGEDAETILKNADIALYRVKEAGRNGFQSYSKAAGDDTELAE